MAEKHIATLSAEAQTLTFAEWEDATNEIGEVLKEIGHPEAAQKLAVSAEAIYLSQAKAGLMKICRVPFKDLQSFTAMATTR